MRKTFAIAGSLFALIVVSVLAATTIWYVQITERGQASIDLTPESRPGRPMDPFYSQPIGDPYDEAPRIAHVRLVDLDQDGLLDVIVCDARKDQVSWLRQVGDGIAEDAAVADRSAPASPKRKLLKFDEIVLLSEVVAPAHCEPVDMDQDGDLDLLVAVLGKLFPSNEKIGATILLENMGKEEFRPHVLQQQVARVSDVRAGDLDGDKDLDLVVTHFGYYDGLVEWLENRGDWQFVPHRLLDLPGGIHGIPRDFDGDGDLDIAVLISQEYETVYLFEGDGRGSFVSHQVFKAGNPDFGSSGLWEVDLDQDGDLDLLYCNGDAFDYSPPQPWPWHGVQWLENLGGLRFRYHRLADLGGAVGAVAGDFDQDDDLDIIVCSTFNNWDSPEAQSLLYLENDGANQFIRHDVTNTPTHIQSIDSGDVDGDGQLDLVSGGMHVSAPYDRVARILLWLHR